MIDNRHAKRSAARKTAPAASASRETAYSRILLILLAFVALTIQVMVVQSHIHTPPSAAKVQSLSLITVAAGVGDDHSAGAPRDKYPVNDDPSNCPLCQQFGHSGQFVASTTVLVSVPYFITVSFIVFCEALPVCLAVSHSWQGRAPPQH